MNHDPAWIVPGKNRRLVAPRGEDKRVKFDRKKRATFLNHLASTCNVTASAALVDVSLSAVYRRRMRDPHFRDEWEQAIEQGYARLEAKLLQQAVAGLDAKVDGDEIAGPVDWTKALGLLRHHRPGSEGRAPGKGAHARPTPIDEVARKLVRRLQAMGVALPPPAQCLPAPEEGEPE